MKRWHMKWQDIIMKNGMAKAIRMELQEKNTVECENYGSFRCF